MSLDSRPSAPLSKTPSSSVHRRDPRRSAAAKTRTATACSSCAQRRHKCDGTQPHCSRCVNNSLQCLYPPTGAKRGKRVSDDCSSYVSAEAFTPPAVPTLRNAGFPESAPHDTPKITEARSGSTLPGGPGVRNVQVLVAGVPHVHHTDVSSSLGPGESVASSPDRDEGWTCSQPVEGLSEHTLQRLLYHYWQLIHVFWPIFQKSEILDTTTSGIYHFVPALAVNAMLLAAAGQIEALPAEDLSVLDCLFWTTEREALNAAINKPSIAACQALLLLALKSQRTGQHTKGWHILGLACRVMQSLGFHRDRASAHGTQIARRLFWTCYVLDKLIGVDLGRSCMLRRVDSSANLVSETEMEETEHIALMFSPETGPAAGRILSTFNAQCRLAFVYEKLMECRRTFASSEARDAVILTIKSICERWREMLPAHLHVNPQSCQQPAMVYALHAMYFSCIALLHLSSATDALKDGKADSYHIQCLSETSAAWTLMTSAAPRHLIYSLQCAHSLSFPQLVLATINNLAATPAMLSSNQSCLRVLTLHGEGGMALDSRDSLLRVMKSSASLAPTEPATIFGAHDSPPHLEHVLGTEATNDGDQDLNQHQHI